MKIEFELEDELAAGFELLLKENELHRASVGSGGKA